MKLIRCLAGAALVAAALAPAGLANGRNAGSALVYPVQRSGPGWFTLVCVTNTNLSPTAGATNVHYEYVNRIPGANPFLPNDCIVFDRVEYLTPADTLCVLTFCHNAVYAGGQEGYLVMSAEDPDLFDTPWSWNFLVGSEVVMNASGGMYILNAIPFNAIAAQGAPTDADGDGQLDFDGVEYEEIPDVLTIDSFVALANSQLAMINFTGGFQALNTILFRVWNDNEFPLSATVTYKCSFDLPLVLVSPLFDNFFLANNTPNDPAETDINCDNIGDIEVGWANIDSILVTLPGGTILTNDGAQLGAITAGPAAFINGGHLLWESVATQDNGQFVDYGL